MSEFECPIVIVDNLEKHPDADTLSIYKHYQYPVIVKTEEFPIGTKAVYFPVDAVLPDVEVFSFLWRDERFPPEKKRRIKACRLRGIFSMGLLIPFKKIRDAFPQLNIVRKEWLPGEDLSGIIGAYKYEEPEDTNMGGNNRSGPDWFCKYTDIENARKYAKIMEPDEPVILTEKIHGSNARFLYRQLGDENDGLWVGSRNLAKQNDDDNIWAYIAKKYDIEAKLKEFPNMIIFGEIYGPVQKGYHYGSPKEAKLILFDIMRIEDKQYLDYYEAKILAENLGFEWVPEIHIGNWTCLEDFLPYAEGNTILGEGKHLREGFVIRPERERFHQRFGRVVLKIHGEGFLTGKKK